MKKRTDTEDSEKYDGAPPAEKVKKFIWHRNICAGAYSIKWREREREVFGGGFKKLRRIREEREEKGKCRY